MKKSAFFFLSDAVLLICLYHTLRSFGREVKCDKMGITSEQRDQCLCILQALAYASDEDAYNRNMDRLFAVGCEKVNKYFKECWDPIRHEWVAGLKERHLTLGDTTNNRLESINAKIKSVCSANACLQNFFKDFHTYLASMRTERRHRALMSFIKIPTNPVPVELVPYFEFLTPFAFGFVMSEHSKSLTVQFTARSDDTFSFTSHDSIVSTTPTSCECRLYRSKGLPCKHILYVRRWLGLTFDETVMDGRWSRVSHMAHCDSLSNEGQSVTVSVSHVQKAAVNSKSILS